MRFLCSCTNISQNSTGWEDEIYIPPLTKYITKSYIPSVVLYYSLHHCVEISRNGSMKFCKMARCFGGLERETSLPYSTQAPLTLFHKVYWYGNNFYSRSVTAVSWTALSGASSMLLLGVHSCFICSRCSSCQWPAVFVLSLLCLPACFVGFQYSFVFVWGCVCFCGDPAPL